MDIVMHGFAAVYVYAYYRPARGPRRGGVAV